jgi:hypothetical protein
MLQDLTPNQLEQAFQWIQNDPLKQDPPQVLKDLNEMEWFLLSRMLDGLLTEKEQSPVH